MQIYDLHCHTKLSSCASRTAEIDEYITLADENSFAAIGFADHAWDSGVEGASPWYAAQPYEQLFERKTDCKKETPRIFYGAEGEFASLRLGVRRETMKKLDYIIIPHSHIHMKGFVLPAGSETPSRKAAYLLESFVALCKHQDSDCIFGIAHPFFPLGENMDGQREILSLLSDSELVSAFETARSKGIFVEFNTSCFNCDERDIAAYPYTRIIRLAKKAGCEFFLGSDRHSSDRESQNTFLKHTEYITEAGLCESDFKAALSHICCG